MSSDKPSLRLNHLLSRLVDGLLDPAETAELNELLLEDPGAREYYRWHAAVQVELEDIGSGRSLLPFPAGKPKTAWPTLAAAAAILLAATGSVVWWQKDPPGGRVPAAVASSRVEPVLAVVNAATDLGWSLDRPAQSGQQLYPGTVRVFSGELTLSLTGGQSIHLRAPAEFELIDTGEFALRGGRAAFRTPGGNSPFIVHLPRGAVVDPGSEYSVNVASDGAADLHVFRQQLTVSSIGESGGTREEMEVSGGDTIGIGESLAEVSESGGDFLRVPPPPPFGSAIGNESYAKAVLASAPAAYWRFEKLDTNRQVADETGSHPLILVGKARLGSDGGQRFLETNLGDAFGFATTAGAFDDLDTGRGVSVECLLFSNSEKYGSAFAFELADPPSADLQIPPRVNHAPQNFVLERMGRRGEHIGHVHPDFALRAMFRSPADYVGGTNLYSRESHLLYRWIHVVVVHDTAGIHLYVDGKPSDHASVGLPFRNANLRPIIGRLQPHARDELRQWVGGIDEVSLYNRALSPAEVRNHYTAIKE